MTPRRRAIDRMNELGWAWVELERRGKYGRTFDIWGCDFMAVDGNFTHLIQVTDSTNHSKRRVKLLAIPELAHWVKSPQRTLLVWSWGERGRGADRAVRLRQEVLSLDQFPGPLGEAGDNSS